MTKQEEFHSEDVDIKRENVPYSKFNTLHEVRIYNCLIYFLANKVKVCMNIIIQFRPSTVKCYHLFYCKYEELHLYTCVCNMKPFIISVASEIFSSLK